MKLSHLFFITIFLLPLHRVAAQDTLKAKFIYGSKKINNNYIPRDKKNNTALTQKTATNPKQVMGKYKGVYGKGGNNQDSYNNIKDQGIAGGKSDQGVAVGKMDGMNYNGTAGPFVTKGDRKVVKAYSIISDVAPAIIYAEIQVSPEGDGTFSNFTKGSSSNDNKYKTAIKEYLKKISFDKADHSSVVTVKFKFEVQ
jgi:hypothetical protein